MNASRNAANYQDVMIVGVNYRLGPWGFFYLNEKEADQDFQGGNAYSYEQMILFIKVIGVSLINKPVLNGSTHSPVFLVVTKTGLPLPVVLLVLNHVGDNLLFHHLGHISTRWHPLVLVFSLVSNHPIRLKDYQMLSLTKLVVLRMIWIA